MIVKKLINEKREKERKWVIRKEEREKVNGEESIVKRKQDCSVERFRSWIKWSGRETSK